MTPSRILATVAALSLFGAVTAYGQVLTPTGTNPGESPAGLPTNPANPVNPTKPMGPGAPGAIPEVQGSPSSATATTHSGVNAAPNSVPNAVTESTAGSGTTANGQAMTTSQVTQSLHAQGFTDISSLVRRGNTYSGVATRNGRSVTVSVNAATGEVITTD